MTVTAAQMKEIERKADESGLSYYQMMENAGTSAYKIICEKYPAADEFIILIGKGNNGGDGCVVARLAAEDGKRAVIITVEGNPVTADAITNFGLLKNLPVEIKTIDEIREAKLSENAVVVDAIYGTGFHGSLRPAGAAACAYINSAPARVAALDVPSGVNCDTAQAADGAVKADITISFHAFKPVHENEAARAYCGESVLADIGIKEKEKNMKICVFGASSSKIDQSYINAAQSLCEELGKRGHSLVFGAGANGLMGAAARGFHKSGAKVTGVVPSFFRTDYVEELYEQCDEFIYTETMAERKAKMEELADVFIVVPGGIGTFEEFFEVLVLKQLCRHNKPIAIYDINNYYESIEALLDHAVDEKFLAENGRRLYRHFEKDEAGALIEYIESEQEQAKPVSEVKYG